jgi:hypothetical protein
MPNDKEELISIWHFWHLAFFGHLAFGIWHLAFGIQH